jgi:hypothetical protein
MEREFRDADFIPVVRTETCRRRFEGREERGRTRGSGCESLIAGGKVLYYGHVKARQDSRFGAACARQ